MHYLPKATDLRQRNFSLRKNTFLVSHNNLLQQLVPFMMAVTIWMLDVALAGSLFHQVLYIETFSILFKHSSL